MKHSERALFDVINDKSADRALRASALLLLFEPVERLYELETTTQSRGLHKTFLELKDAFDQVAARTAGFWVPKDYFRAALRKRIWDTSTVWLIHGGKQDIWERVGNYITTSLQLRYIEFNSPNAERVDIKGRLHEMVSTSSIAVAVMSGGLY